MSEKIREEFEEYASQHYWMREHGFDYSRDVVGEYASDEMQLAWEFWKASRESLVVEIPYPGHWTLDRDMVIEAIQAAGASVK